VFHHWQQNSEKSKMQNSLTTTSENLPAQYEDPVEQLAAEARNDFGTLLKFAKGEWFIGDSIVLNNDTTEFIAHVDSLVVGWIRFDDKKVAERILLRRGEQKRLPDRDELSFADKAEWPLDTKGVARDPWVKQHYLPLLDTKDGALVTFVSGTVGGRIAVGKLCDLYLKTRQRPVIGLDVGYFKSKEFGKVAAPAFRMIGYEDAIPAGSPEPVIASAQNAKEHAFSTTRCPFDRFL
jgi:hypothetical protein